MNIASLVAFRCFHRQSGWRQQTARKTTKNNNKVRTTQNFLKLKKGFDIVSSRKQELEKRPDVFLTCNYTLLQPHKFKKVGAVTHKAKQSWVFPDLQLGQKVLNGTVEMRECFTCPLHRQEHVYKVTDSNQSGLGVVTHPGQMARNRQFTCSIAISLVRAWMKQRQLQKKSCNSI